MDEQQYYQMSPDHNGPDIESAIDAKHEHCNFDSLETIPDDHAELAANLEAKVSRIDSDLVGAQNGIAILSERIDNLPSVDAYTKLEVDASQLAQDVKINALPSKEYVDTAISNVPFGFKIEEVIDPPLIDGENGVIYVQPDGTMWVWEESRNRPIQVNGMTDISGLQKKIEIHTPDIFNTAIGTKETIQITQDQFNKYTTGVILYDSKGTQAIAGTKTLDSGLYYVDITTISSDTGIKSINGLTTVDINGNIDIGAGDIKLLNGYTLEDRVTSQTNLIINHENRLTVLEAIAETGEKVDWENRISLAEADTITTTVDGQQQYVIPQGTQTGTISWGALTAPSDGYIFLALQYSCSRHDGISWMRVQPHVNSIPCGYCGVANGYDPTNPASTSNRAFLNIGPIRLNSGDTFHIFGGDNSDIQWVCQRADVLFAPLIGKNINAGIQPITVEEDPIATPIINGHILEDNDVRWPSIIKSISDLRVELKQFVIDTYAGTIPEYDYSQTQTILIAGGLVNLADQGTYTIPINGAIQAQVGGLLGAGLQVQVNGETVWTAPLNLLVSLNSPEIKVNSGDEISYVGVVGLGQTIQIDYFPNKGT